MILDYEIIVSFSSSDNSPVNPGKEWVLQFSKYLKATLFQISGIEPRLILHSEEDVFDSSHYHHNTLIVMVISPQYLSSGLFEREIHGFINAGMNIQSASERIMKVLKFQVDDSTVPEAIKHLLPYPFYKENSIKYHTHEVEWHSDQWMKMLDLGYDIQRKAEEKRNNIFGLKIRSNKPIKKVYLAQTGNDLYVHREIIHRELVRQQIEVLPTSILPDDIVELEHIIRKEMEECELSIHLIGEDYGFIPKGTDRSIVDIQNKIAVEISSDPFREKINDVKPFARYVWISPDLKKINEKQKIFIENIKRDSKSLKEDEILQIPFDELKEIIQNKIVANNNFSEKVLLHANKAKKGKGTIYLIYENLDQHMSNEIAAYLEVEGYDVIFSDFNGDQLSVRKKHQEYLCSCDAAVIICGEVNIEWINSKLQDLIKAPGFGRSNPFKAKALFIKNEKYLHIHHKLMNLDDSIILDISAKIIPENILLFLNKITA